MHQVDEKKGSDSADFQGQSLRPPWLKKDFEGMAQGAPPPVSPGRPRFQVHLPGSSRPPFRLPGRLVGTLVVIGLVVAFFYLSPRLTESAFQVSGLKDLVEDPTLPSQVIPHDPASLAALKNLELNAILLNHWSDKKWVLLYSSNDLELSLTNSKLYSTLLSLKPKGFSSQDFVQAADPCQPPTCQVSWAGMVFENATLALQAFDVLDKDLKTSSNGYASLGFNDDGYQPARSCLSKVYADSGWVSCLFQWNNLVTSMRTYTQDPADQIFVNSSIQLIEQVNSAWVQQWNQKSGRTPIP